MMTPHRQLAALLLSTSVYAAAQAKPPALEPVHWSAEASLPQMVRAGTRYSVLLHATIDEGWHLYALPGRDDNPLATEVALAHTDAADLLRVEEEKPRHSLDPDSRTVTAWFAQTATFTLRLAATGSAPPRGLQVLVRYQACNDRMCLPVKQATVPVQLSVTR